MLCLKAFHSKSQWKPLEVGNRKITLPDLIYDLPLEAWADQNICAFLQKSPSSGSRTRCETESEVST